MQAQNNIVLVKSVSPKNSNHIRIILNFNKTLFINLKWLKGINQTLDFVQPIKSILCKSNYSNHHELKSIS